MTDAIIPCQTPYSLESMRHIFDTAFDYCADSGVLTWKYRPESHFSSYRSWRMYTGKYAGKEAGSVLSCKNNKYKRVKISGKNILAHRIIWVMVFGAEPDQIDHINGNGLDNRLVNLRDTTSFGNMKNRSVSLNNSSGIMGVYWYKANNKWGVIIATDNKRLFLGLHEDYFEACCIRKSAENRLGFHKNHGRPRIAAQ